MMDKPVKVAIIGGSGKMGQWFARFLLQEGKQVVITGRDPRKLAAAQQALGVKTATNAEAVKWADVVVLSVSIDNVAAVIKEVAPHIKPHQLVIDITSVKEQPVEVMHQYIKTGTVLGAHPMFGPGATSISGQNFVLTPTNEAESALANKVKDYLEARDAVVTIMPPRQHDELMAVVLGLSHFIGLVAADTLANRDNLEAMKAVSGSTFKLLLSLVKAVIYEDPQFYSSLQMSLPHLPQIEHQFGDNAHIWADMVASKDRQAFIQRMNELKNRLEKSP